MIQTKEIKQYVKKSTLREKNNQSLLDFGDSAPHHSRENWREIHNIS